MKKIFGNLFLATMVVVGMSSVASAAPLCSNQAVTAGLTCSLGTLTFSFSNVAFAPTNVGDTLQLEAATTGVNGGDVVLGFQISPGKGFPVDIIIDYTVVSSAQTSSGSTLATQAIPVRSSKTRITTEFWCPISATRPATTAS